ncbi:MAG: polysaccharide deacetylase family protein [Firmicutes bacterium]|nr:polysaccharide deacetylase family protein [Bacillota bacterium]
MGKKRRRVKIHYGRFIVFLLILIIIVGGIIFAVSSCNKDTYRSESGFEDYAAEYFESIGGAQEYGNMQQSINYGDVKSVALQFPEFGEGVQNDVVKKVLRDAQDSFNKKHNAAADKGEGQYALMIGYESYKTDQEINSLAMYTSEREEIDGDMQIVDDNVHAYNFIAKNGMELSATQIFRSDYKKGVSKYVKEYLNDEYGDELLGGYEKYISADADNFNEFILTDDGVTFFLDDGTVLPPEKGIIKVRMSDKDLKGIKRDKINLRAMDPNKPMVALTYDDGPRIKSSNRILDVMEKYGVVATFFEVGRSVDGIKGADKVLKRELELGCEIGSHSYTHADLSKLSKKKIRREVRKSTEAIKRACGQAPTVFRPPYGNANKKICKIIDMPCILWYVDTWDWSSRNSKKIVKVIKKEKNLDGKVILMHSIYDSSAKATEKIVPWLIKEGYQLVTVSELIKYKYNEEPKNGKLYGYTFFYSGE